MDQSMNETKNGAGSKVGTTTQQEAVKQLPDPRVTAKAYRRQYSTKYKLQVLEEADRCVEPGQLGELLRREGLYTSHLSQWRRARREGVLSGLSPKKRGPKRPASNPLAAKLSALSQEKQWLERKLERAEKIIEAQKKLSELLGIELGSEAKEARN